MSESMAGGRKICCKCNIDVTGAPRMKDQQGRYWCMPCGEQDRRHQSHASGGICEGCGESFSSAQLMEISGQILCPACRKRKFTHGLPGEKAESGGILGSVKSLFGKKLF